MDARVSRLGIPVPKMRTTDMDTDGLGAARTFPIPALQPPPPLSVSLFCSLVAGRVASEGLKPSLPHCRHSAPLGPAWSSPPGPAYYDYYVFYGCGLVAGCSVTHTHAPGHAQPGLGGGDSAWQECKSVEELKGPA